MTHLTDKEYKVLRNSYILLVLGSLGYFLIILFQKSTFLKLENIHVFDVSILISLTLSVIVLFLGNFYFNKQLTKLTVYKGLAKKKMQMYIDATIMRLFSIEFVIILNILFFKQTNNLIFVIIALIFIIYLLIKMPNKKI